METYLLIVMIAIFIGMLIWNVRSKFGDESIAKFLDHLAAGFMFFCGVPILAWWIWRPLGAYLAITLAAGQTREFLKTFSYGWSDLTVRIVCVLNGFFMAAFVWLLYSLAVHSALARALFCAFGLMATGYSLYYVKRSGGIFSYSILAVILLYWPTVQTLIK